MTFGPDARLDLDAEEQYLLDKHRLYDRVVYNSEAFYASPEHRRSVPRCGRVTTKHATAVW